jgi:hypothetical protein
MGAGHGGKSGRWSHLREVAEAYAFVLTQMGKSIRLSRESGNPSGGSAK